jgi:G3E family GTPase
VTVLTGFLGSGKTTLLNRLLKAPALAGAAVIVNEFGEIGLDHLLIEASEEQFTLLDNGCVCCTVRGDLVATLCELDRRSRAGEIPPLTRVVIETTGLADPAPILHSLMVEPQLVRSFCVGAVVATVDAVNGAATLERHAEAARQVAVADRILLTKVDLAPADVVAALSGTLAALAPLAERRIAHNGVVEGDTASLLDGDAVAVNRPPAWLAGAAALTPDVHRCGPDCWHRNGEGRAVYAADGGAPMVDAVAGNHHGIASWSFVIDQPVEWTAFARWLEYIAVLKGEDLLRLKGLVHVAEHPEQPLVLHGVQHVFHPPVRLEAWPSADRRTRLVFIVRNIPREVIARTLAKFAGISTAAAPVRTAA